jgi:CarD family transcriptional regulator
VVAVAVSVLVGSAAVSVTKTAVAAGIAAVNTTFMTFKIGERVVHPQHGVGQVVKLDDREFGSGVTRRYYEISILSAGSTLWVPMDPPSFGLRGLAERGEINICRKILVSRPSPLVDDARSRQSVLAERLKQGTIRVQCEVVRDLYAFGEHKSLYGTMAGFYRQTQNVLCEEWAIVEGMTLEQAAQEVATLLEKSRSMVNKSKA